jgi:hypothetical protein
MNKEVRNMEKGNVNIMKVVGKEENGCRVRKERREIERR